MQMTARGRGAIAVIMVAGDGACAALEQIAPDASVRTLAVGRTKRANVRAGTATDDALIVRMEHGKYELHVHGGPAVVAGVLESLQATGAKVIQPMEAATASWLGNVLEGEIVACADQAVTETSLRLLAAQGESGLHAWAKRWGAWLTDPANTGQTWKFHSAVQWVLERSEAFDRLLRPARVAIVGAPNVGKSTLANALLGRPVSITSAIAGTTRDWVDALVVFTNSEFRIQNSELIVAPVVLVDTAGVRATTDAIETESIVRTHQQAGTADVVIVVLDGTRAPAAQEMALLAAYGGGGGSLVVAVNKSDQPAAWDHAKSMPGSFAVSALAHAGLERLMAAVLEALDLNAVGEAETWVFTPRQKDLLERASVAEAAEAAALLHQLLGDKQ